MVTSQGGMSEAFTAVVQMATERRRFTKSPPLTKRKGHVATFPVAHALEMHFSRSVKNAELDTWQNVHHRSPVRISRMCKKGNAACNYTCSFPTPNFVESCTLHVRNVPWNSPTNFLLLFCSLSLLSLYSHYIHNLPSRMSECGSYLHSVLRQNSSRNCPGNLSWEFVLFFSELVGLTTARCCCCCWTAHLQWLQRNLCVRVPLAWLLW
jgi:hypothetical protein